VIAGILLAAGTGGRFGSNKLLHSLSDGIPLAVAALRNLRQGVDEVLIVVRPDDAELIRILGPEGANIIPCGAAARGMGASLACGVRAGHAADGWLVALGDMPDVPPTVVAQLADRLRNGAAIVAPVCNGQRGHPVGFSREFFESLAQLDGDTGARQILETHAARLELIESDDTGILRDIDTPTDLGANLRGKSGNRL
jgi:molybdenum cofactor cytidylyltransferase